MYVCTYVRTYVCEEASGRCEALQEETVHACMYAYVYICIIIIIIIIIYYKYIFI
jgi:hypothetical protein